jgi:hypothetical protein
MRVLGIVLPVGVVTVVIGVIAVTAGPQIWATATTRVLEDDTTIDIVGARGQATIDVPGGWAVRPAPFDRSRVGVVTPDAGMVIEVQVLEGVDARTAIDDAAPVPVGRTSTERIGEGRMLVHARSADGSVISGAVVSGRTLVRFTARPVEGFEAELAGLLDSIQVHG